MIPIHNNFIFQNKVYEEMMQVLPEEDSFLSIQNLSNLRYMENVIKETLRLFPTVPMIGRTILEDVVLPSKHVVFVFVFLYFFFLNLTH